MADPLLPPAPALTFETVWDAVFDMARQLGNCTYAEARLQAATEADPSRQSPQWLAAMEEVKAADWMPAHNKAKALISQLLPPAPPQP